MDSNSEQVRFEIIFQGRVQGVGFRYTCLEISRSYSVTGWVMNRSDGTVEMIAEGPRDELDRFVGEIKRKIQNSRSGLIESMDQGVVAAKGDLRGFAIRR